MSGGTWLTILLSTISGAGIAQVIRAWSRRRVDKVDAATALGDTAIQLVKNAEASAEQARQSATAAWREADLARREAAEARNEAAESRREASAARREAAEIGRDLRALRTVIVDPFALHDPVATVHRLRAMVGADSANGVG